MKCRTGRYRPWGRSINGRLARASSISMASSAVRPTSIIPASTREPRRSSRPRRPEEGYTLTEDLADRAITWVRQQKALMPDKPFFMYFAPGATHAPHHVPKEWSDKYKGKFDAGWDKLREEIFARQKKLGVVPEERDAYRTPRRDPGLGCDGRRAEAGAGAPDGDLCRLPRTDRSSCRPARSIRSAISACSTIR